MAGRGATALGRLLGRRVRDLRLLRDWGQVDLEAHLDGATTRSSISYIENGKIFPSRDTLFALARAFEVPAAALFLDPADRRQRIALAVLECDDDLLPALEKLVDIDAP